MKLFKNLRAYYTGMFKCNSLDMKLLPPYVYSYSKDEVKWFIKGLLKSADVVDGKLLYKHPSMVYIVNVEKLLKDNGYKTTIISNDDSIHYIEIIKK